LSRPARASRRPDAALRQQAARDDPPSRRRDAQKSAEAGVDRPVSLAYLWLR